MWQRYLSEIANFPSLFNILKYGIGHCRNSPLLSPIFQDHFLPAHKTSGSRGYPSILMGLYGSTRQIHVNKQGLICGERKVRVASGSQYQGQERRDWRLYEQVYDCHFPEQRCDSIFSVWWEHKWRIVFTVRQGQFPHFFSKGNNQKGKLFLQDGDSSQNCKMSQEAMDEIPYRLFMIPPRSLDLNSIENISSCWHVSKERCYHKEEQKRDLWTVL